MAKTNGELKIESGIPLPTNGHGSITATLRAMKVGDSVLLPDAAMAANAHHVLGAGNYTRRKVEGGIRVWRTK